MIKFKQPNKMGHYLLLTFVFSVLIFFILDVIADDSSGRKQVESKKFMSELIYYCLA